MNPLQLLKFALHGLWRQKVRTSLTLVGVTVGTCALAFSLSLGLGLRTFIDTEFKGRDDFWRIIVLVDQPPPDESKIPEKDRPKMEVQADMTMPDERKARLREALVDHHFASNPRKPEKALTPEAIDAIAKMPAVSEVRTFRTGTGTLKAGGKETVDTITVSGPLEDLRARLIVGRLPESPDADEIVLSELALYQLDQFGVRDDAKLEEVLGKEVTLIVGGANDEAALASAILGRKIADKPTPTQLSALKKIRAKFPQAVGAFDLSDEEKVALLKLLTASTGAAEESARESSQKEPRTYRVCGVVKVLTREDKKILTPLDSVELQAGHAFLPRTTGEKHFGQLSWVKDRGFQRADVRIKPGADLSGTVKDIEAMGFRTHSGAKWFAAAKREVTLIAAGLNLFAFIALFVASVGITNTLVTSVIERTREIGVLRAVGATRGQIMSLFLMEGAMIGFLGAGLGLALARVLAMWADDWVKSLIASQMDGRPMLTTTIFEFPGWLWAGSVVFAVGVTTLAALYPARRAAKIHPIEALRFG